MTQPPSNSTLDPYSSSGSSARPSLGSFELISESQYHRDQGGGYGSNGGHMAVPESTEQFHPYMNLPSNVKLPPSYKQSEYPQEYRCVSVCVWRRCSCAVVWCYTPLSLPLVCLHNLPGLPLVHPCPLSSPHPSQWVLVATPTREGA